MCETATMARETEIRSDNPADWQRLGRLMRQRRHELGITQKQAGQPATQVWSDLEGGLPRNGESIEDLTASKIERALGWKPGSVQRIIMGASKPTLLEDVPDPRFVAGSQKELQKRVTALETEVAQLKRAVQTMEPIVKALRSLR